MNKLLITLTLMLVGVFGMHATTIISSVKSGDWEDATVWDLGRLPTNGDIVVITASHTVTVTTNNETCIRNGQTRH